MRKRWIARAGIVALGLIAAACRQPRAPADVLLISLDTVRADLLESSPAEPEVAMPTLRAFAERSLWFTRAFAPMAFTLPSHMSVFTGLHPETHGVTQKSDVLAEGVPTLAELLHAQGYRTAGVVGSSWLKSTFGFDRGFDRYEALAPGLTYAPRVRAFVEDELRNRGADGPPLFLFAHFFDAHSDFGAEANRLTYFSPPAYRRELAIDESWLCDAQRRCATDLLRFADREQREMPAAEIGLHRRLYRLGARSLDDELRLFFSLVEQRARPRDLLILLFADHGEEFREHGKFLHSQVYRESLHVPLILRLPGGREGGRVDAGPVGLVDVAPTLLAALGLEAPRSLQGRDLLAADRPPAGPAIQVAQDKLLRSRYALRTPERLLTWDFDQANGSWFDLASDPGEQQARAISASAELRDRLFAALRQLRAGRPTGPRRVGPEFSEAESAVLRSLGYL